MCHLFNQAGFDIELQRQAKLFVSNPSSKKRLAGIVLISSEIRTTKNQNAALCLYIEEVVTEEA